MGKRIWFLFIVAVLFNSCTKQVPGPKGDPGTPGKNGNSDQFSTAVFELKDTDWVYVFEGNSTTPIWKAIRFVDIITKHALQNGDIKVYVERDGWWHGLPLCEDELFYQYVLRENTLELINNHFHGEDIPRPATMKMRVSVIAPKL